MSQCTEPDTEIVGGPELFIDRGSTINLTCVVRHSPEPPAYIFWNHNDAVSIQFILPKTPVLCLSSWLVSHEFPPLLPHTKSTAFALILKLI
ncbi:hypothetical protein NQ314_012887 [Rhamnusium bicolor]|uniref:Ig-like domain-containing protein n=1 Tax=Rhamnusium bicolor TaxID=1586634 RepID=A0AAV8XA17_9CUCU|nr:hypothetical protein NQ314_012887 [Rhamnusium bicolor]